MAIAPAGNNLRGEGASVGPTCVKQPGRGQPPGDACCVIASVSDSQCPNARTLGILQPHRPIPFQICGWCRWVHGEREGKKRLAPRGADAAEHHSAPFGSQRLVEDGNRVDRGVAKRIDTRKVQQDLAVPIQPICKLREVSAERVHGFFTEAEHVLEFDERHAR